MYEGIVCSVREDRSFGFISASGQPDVFFHCSDLAEGLEFGAQLQERRVKFDIVSTAKGNRAANITAAG